MNDNEKRQIIKEHRFSFDSDTRYWTDEEKKRLKHMYREGYGISEIAISLNRSEVAIHLELYALDCYPRKRREYQKRLKNCNCLCPECIARFECEHYSSTMNSTTDVLEIGSVT